jgi:transcriptional regulator with XRE-family HTH domain
MTVTQVPQWTLGDRIRKAREFAGLDQDDIASALYMSRAAVSAWENNHSKPNARKLEVIASKCGVPLLWLVTGTFGDAVTDPNTHGDYASSEFSDIDSPWAA